MTMSSRPHGGRTLWGRYALLAGLTIVSHKWLACNSLEILDTVIDRDGDALIVEDILEGFGELPVSVDFSPVSEHMFVGFKPGIVRIYPDGPATEQAVVFDECVDMKETVYDNNDLGLLNFRLHPDWPTAPYGYMLYTHDVGYEDDCLVPPLWCEKDHRLVRIEVAYNEASGAVTCGTQEILINDWCTGSNHHGGGGMSFLSNGDMVLAVGDMAKPDQVDAGDQEENSCLRQAVDLPQGNFRAQRDDFNEGKLLRITAEAIVKDAPATSANAGFLERDEDFFLEAKGFRNPFRLAVIPESGDVIIADVGLDTLESIKVVPNPLETAATASMGNHGWPCIEGDAWIPVQTNQWLVDNNSDMCDSVRGTTLGLPFQVDYDELKQQALAGEVDWVPPAFTYKDDVLDEEYPETCSVAQSSVSAVYVYQGTYLPDRYQNALFVGDYSKGCVFYFDMNAKTGKVDWTTPHVLFDGRAIVDFRTDPKTGVMYAIDAQYHILVRFTAEGGVMSGAGPSVVLEADVLAGPVPLEVTIDASNSSDTSGIVSLQWDCDGDGTFEATSDWSVATARTHVCTYDVDGAYEATVQATNAQNGSTVESIEILAGDASSVSEAPTMAPAAAPTTAPIPTSAPVAPPTGTALESPPVLKWELNEGTGVYVGEIELGVVTVDNFWGETTTRGYNGQLPGPTIRMEACQTYQLSVTNALDGTKNPDGDWNTMQDPNTTNIHTHGLHISGESPADDVLYVEILPGEGHSYMYTIPCDHAGGTFWYHPHHHGSTSLQMGGGAMGALIIEDRPDIHGIPDQIADMPELVLTIQEMNPELTIFDRDATGGELYNTTATSIHYLLNGEVVPTIQMTTGGWVRFRMAFAGHGDNHAISIDDPDGDCEMAVLAKDGVYLGEVPRMEPKLFFTPASRVDAAVRCSVAGDYGFNIESSTSLGQTSPLAMLSVEGGSVDMDADLDTWEPCRPYYLQDLVDEDFDEDGTYSLFVRTTIGDKPYTGPDNYLVNMSVNELHEWNLEGSEQHPFHIHVNHVQFVSVDGPALVPGWNQVGDWVDTVSTSLAVVRFRTERYGGHVAMHCHVNSHSDTGIMAVANIKGGEGANEDPIALAAGTCGVEGVQGFGYNADGETSTPEPSAGEDGEGTGASGRDVGGDSVDPADSWWVAAAAGAGIGLAIVVFGIFLFTKLGKKKQQPRYGTMSKVSAQDTASGDGYPSETKAEPVF